MVQLSTINETLDDLRLRLNRVCLKQAGEEDRLESTLKRVSFLESDKADSAELKQLRKHWETQNEGLMGEFQRTKHRVLESNNYMEKYLPLYLQRQMTEFMEYVF